MQLWLYIIGVSVLVVLFIVWIFFYTMEASRKKRELLAVKVEDEKDRIKAPKIIKKQEIYYQLNTHAIRLNLYPKSHFKNYIVEEIYQKIVIDNYWLEEPFHTEFYKMLQFIGSNKLWIKDPKTREIIINTRDNNDKLSKKTSMNVLALNEVLESILYGLLLDLKRRKIVNKKDIQNAILSASIYVLSKSGEIDFICQNLGVTYSDRESLRYALVDKICENILLETKNKIVKDDFLNFTSITKIYNEVLLIQINIHILFLGISPLYQQLNYYHIHQKNN
ncbi:MAG: hypothetical protein DRG78_04220 [Epsilonproteobacteria bacterium]|nr:MAG: hypothetical protein DRG78_04220 [Campylobacterota bacterium]